jgi:hypothetical protein
MTLFTYAQGDYSFKVLANKGTNQIKRASGETVELKSRELLYSGDVVIASGQVYIGIMHKSGKTLEIREAGSFAVTDLLTSVENKQSSSLSKYAKMVSGKVSSEGSSSKNQVASRSLGTKINLLLPESTNFYGSKATVKWTSAQEVSNYRLEVKDIAEEVIYSIETSDAEAVLDFASIPNDMGLYVVSVSKDDDPSFSSANHPIKLVTADEMPDLEESLKSIASDISQNGPLDNIVLASFYEDNDLYLNAFQCYQQAIKQAPDVEEFGTLYQNFLTVNGVTN